VNVIDVPVEGGTEGDRKRPCPDVMSQVNLERGQYAHDLHVGLTSESSECERLEVRGELGKMRKRKSERVDG
jgi:hypothetical protein